MGELLSFLEKSRKNIFAIRLTKKNFVKHIENLPQHLSEKFIGDSLSIIDIALRNWDLSIIGITQGFFEVIDYRYRCSTERFIVPITVYMLYLWHKKPHKIISDFMVKK